jgi:PAS domain S-box-containing protein
MRIFLIEDNPVDALWLKRELSRLPDEFSVYEAQSLAEAKEPLSTQSFEVILLDLGLPDSSGMDSLLEIVAVASDTPVVVLTGMDDQQLAVEAVANGAQDYLVKGSADLHSVVRSLNYAIERHQILKEHKEAVEKERQAARSLKVLSECNEVLVRAVDEIGFLNEMCRIIVDTGGYRMAWVGYAIHDENKTVKPIAISGAHNGYLQEIGISWDENRPKGQGPMGRAIRSGEVQVVKDLSAEQTLGPWQENYAKLNFKSMICLPLSANGSPIGALVIWSREPGAFHDEEVALWRQLADDVSYGIASIRNRLAREQAEKDLREAQERLQLAVEGADLVPWERDPRTHRLFFSGQIARVLEFSPDEIPHVETYKRLIHEEDLPGTLAIADAFLKEEIPTFEAEYRIKTKSGAWKWVANRGRIVERDNGGEPLKVAGILMDVTARKHAERALRESEARFRAIFEGAEDHIFIKDADLKYVQVNPSMAKAAGRKPSDFVGRKAEDIYGSELGRSLADMEIHALEGETIEGERTFPINNIPLIFSYTITPIKDIEGKAVGIFGISRDVTDRRPRERYSTESAEAYPSKAMRSTLDMARRVAERDSVVLLLGESGSGKDYVAKYIHAHSRRKNGPYISLNCAAIAPNLAESELFGHEKGAFTGAMGRKRGMLELAEQGTLLLNEVGELPLPLQSKLLTFLDTRRFTRVGGEKEISVNARIIAATNRDLEKEVAQGHFRKDLFYRFNVIKVTIPPLRERLDDIPNLANEILSRLADEMQLSSVPVLDMATLNALSNYDWPGNVREFRNVLERALITSDGKRFDVMLPAGVRMEEAGSITVELYGRTLREVTEEITRHMCVDALRRSSGNKREAAKLLGIARDSLYRYLRQFGMLSGAEGDQ